MVALDQAPTMGRRLAAMFYEGVLLFGVLMISGLVLSIATEQTHALQGQWRMRAFLFFVLGAYFIYFWTHGGQTLAMKTWQIRLVSRGDLPVGLPRAAARYLLAWLWFLPALAMAWAIGWHTTFELYAMLAIGMVLYAGLSLLLPGKQYLHDWLCGTRLRPSIKAVGPAKRTGTAIDDSQ